MGGGSVSRHGHIGNGGFCPDSYIWDHTLLAKMPFDVYNSNAIESAGGGKNAEQI